MIGNRSATAEPIHPTRRTARGGAGALAFPNVHPFRRVRPGAALFHEGDEPDWIYEVVRGMLKLSKVTSEGAAVIVDFLLAGDMVNLSEDGHCSNTAEALCETWVVAHARPAPGAPQSASGELMENMLRKALRRHVRNERRLMLFRLRRPHQRLAAFLVDMAERQKERVPRKGDRLALPMCRRDLADYLSVAPETLSRVMRSLREDGLIEVHGHREIELRDVNGLAALSGGMC